MEDTRAWDLRSTVHPDDLARYVNQWDKALATGQPMESEVRLRQADRKYRWWLTRNVPLANNGRGATFHFTLPAAAEVVGVSDTRT